MISPKCVLYLYNMIYNNIRYWLYVLLFMDVYVITTNGITYNISPEAIKCLIIGYSSIRFYASFSGMIEYVIIPRESIIRIEGDRKC